MIDLKKYVFVMMLLSPGILKAQGSYNYTTFGLGLGASLVQPHADLKKEYADKAYNLNFTYYFSPYLPIVMELQFGKLRGGGNTVAQDKDTRRYANNYKALLLHVNYQLGEIIDYQRNDFLNIIKNFYLGVGAGALYNSVNVNRRSLLDPSYVFPGDDNSVCLMVPLRVGYEFKIFDYFGVPKFAIDVGYEHNVVLGEGLDGYNDPSTRFKNNALDQYRQVTVGIKYNFGPESSYDRPIKGY